jgi:hypothetical protein
MDLIIKYLFHSTSRLKQDKVYQKNKHLHLNFMPLI